MRDLTDNQKTLALRFAHVPLPAYAVDCEPWVWYDEAWRRIFTVKEWQVGAVLISVSGEQTHQGIVTHWMYLGGEDHFDASDWRVLKQALQGAGQLLQVLNRERRHQAGVPCTSPIPRLRNRP